MLHIFLQRRIQVLFFLFCLLWSLSSHSRILHSYGDVTTAGEGLQILTNARRSWPMSSEGSLKRATPTATRASVYNLIR